MPERKQTNLKNSTGTVKTFWIIRVLYWFERQLGKAGASLGMENVNSF